MTSFILPDGGEPIVGDPLELTPTEIGKRVLPAFKIKRTRS